MGSPTLAGFPSLTGAAGSAAAALGEGALSLRVVVRTPTVETFIQRYSRFVKDDRIFIFTKSSQPPGTRLRFTLELVDGRPLVTGEGTVTRVRAETQDANRPPGMELSFVPIDEMSRKIVQLMLDERMARGPKTASLTAPPLPPSPQLPALPLTGAFSSIDAKAALGLGASPLLRGPIAGQAVDLPQRPGTLRALERDAKASELPRVSKMHQAVASPAADPGPLIDMPAEPQTKSERMPSVPLSPLVAEARLAAEATPGVVAKPASSPSFDSSWDPEPADLPPRATETAVEPAQEETAGVVIDVPAEAEVEPISIDSSQERPAPPVLRPPSVTPTLKSPQVLVPPARSVSAEEPATVASQLDADSLFNNLGEVAAPLPDTADVPEPDGTPLPAPMPAATFGADDISFPGLEEPPAFAEGWRRPSADGSTVPANPFSEISDNAIEYFVEWSLERSTGAMKSVDKKASASFGAVAMKAPESEPTPRSMRFGLGIGLALGALLGGTAVWLVKPRATAPPVPVVVAAQAPEPAKPAPVAPKATPPSDAVAPPIVAPVQAHLSNDFAIVSKPIGAHVTVDGKPLGKTPTSLPLSAGPHDVILTLERYAEYEATVDVPGKLEAQLKRPRATLQITSSPSGADVVVSGEPHGKTPAQVALPQYESYTVEVTLSGKAWKRKVYVNKATTTVQAALAGARPAAARPTQSGHVVEIPGRRSTGIR